MKVFALTDKGSVRVLNEDSYYAPAPGEEFCCVADGMGGHNAGEVASAIAAEVFADRMRDTIFSPHDRLRRAVSAANKVIFDKAAGNQELSGMGTTITGLLVENGEAHIAHVGDSRCYLLRNRALIQVTSDHTLVEELLLKGAITVREAKNHPQRNVVTRALGTEMGVMIDLLRVRTLPGDIFMLCSDGLSGLVSHRDMTEILNSRMRCEDKAVALVSKAIDAGGYDNITVLLAEIEEDPK